MNGAGQTSKVTGTGYTYRYLLPKGFTFAKKYPVVIYLHRASENGTDGLLPLQGGNNSADGALALVSTANPDNQTNHPCFFIVPQCPVGASWSSDAAATEIANILADLGGGYEGAWDTNRIYVTGQYEGGTGAYDMPYYLAKPNHLGANPFAAAIPMWSAAPNRDASTQPLTPLWIFNAFVVGTTSVVADDNFMFALWPHGFSIVYTDYEPSRAGDLWGELAYQEPLMLPWLFSQSLGQPQQPYGNFALNGETFLGGATSIALNGVASTATYTNILWTNETTDQGSGIDLTTQSWATAAIPVVAGTNHVEVFGRGNSYTGYVFGAPANYNAETIVNIPVSVSPTSNLALHGSVSASSVENASYPATNAVDGSLSTRWSSAYSDPQWIEVDLGAVYDLSEVDLTWEAAYGKNYQIQTSTDNINWTTATTVTGNTSLGKLAYTYGAFDPPSGRYVRVLGQARGTQYGYSLFEFAVYGQNTIAADLQPPTLSNVALGKATTVSSVETSALVGANAVDGNINTRWSSLYSDQQWIEVDLGAPYDISEIDLTWETACGKDYQIQTSLDNSNWTTQTNVTGNTKTGLLTYPYPKVFAARYVRMYGTARATSYGYSIFEFAVLSNGGMIIPNPIRTNLALTGAATASSLESSAFPASNAIDGNGSTRWSSAYSDNQWLQVDLGAVHTVNEVDLTWEAACGKNYLIETSLDGTNWTTQFTVAGNSTTGLHQYTLPHDGVSARYVRMQGQARATVYGYSLYEMAVLGQ